MYTLYLVCMNKLIKDQFLSIQIRVDNETSCAWSVQLNWLPAVTTPFMAWHYLCVHVELPIQHDIVVRNPELLIG